MATRPNSHVRQQKAIKDIQEGICTVCWDMQKQKARGHHVIPFSEDGSDSIVNFITLCDDCHKAYHSGKINIDIYRF